MAVLASDAGRKQAQDQIETLARSLFAIHGFPAPGGDQLGTIVERAMAKISPKELRDPKNISVASVGEIDGLAKGSVGAGVPRNDFGAEAARAAQAPGAGTHHGWHHDGAAHGRYGPLGAGRGGREAVNDSGGGEGSGGSASRAGNSGGSYATAGTGGEPAGAPFWGSSKGMMMTRAYANDNNMNWAPPDLMKVSRPALQAIKDSGLKGDGYQALRKPSGMNLDNPTVVNLAKYFKDNGGKANDAAKHMDQAQQVLKGPNKKRLSGAIKSFADPNDGLSIDQKRDKADADFDGIVASQPEATPQINQLRKDLHTKKGLALDAEAAASKSDAAASASADAAKKDGAEAKKDGAEAKKDDATARKDGAEAKKEDATAKQKGTVADAKAASNDDTSAKMAELLKKRQAAASAPKPPGG